MTGKPATKVPLSQARRLNVTKPVGVEISMIIDGQSNGTRYLSENMTRVAPGVTLKPAHSHVNIEEIVYVLEGEGEIWVDGDTCKIEAGDSVFYPANSVHTVKNTGSETLVLLCFFSSAEFRKEGNYIAHQDVDY